eukprot:8436138-Heterocapsa_arctica.AAC.1
MQSIASYYIQHWFVFPASASNVHRRLLHPQLAVLEVSVFNGNHLAAEEHLAEPMAMSRNRAVTSEPQAHGQARGTMHDTYPSLIR